jgi:hypothetical protein
MGNICQQARKIIDLCSKFYDYRTFSKFNIKCLPTLSMGEHLGKPKIDSQLAYRYTDVRQ